MHSLLWSAVVLMLWPLAALGQVHVRDHGAAADGKTDDTAAIQKALDAAGADRGGVVLMPKGLYRVDGNLILPPGVCLTGEWQAPHHANTEHGTVIVATGNVGNEDAPPLITLQQSSAVKGLTIYYPDQDPQAVKPYPWTIQGKGMHGSVIDVTLVNPYKAVDFGTHPNELHHIRNLFGCPLKIGIYIDRCTDIGRVENVHFNPHAWGRCTMDDKARGKGWSALKQYLEQNLVGFLIGRTDWEYMSGCFVIFPKIGMHFIKSESGVPNVVISQSGSDIGPIAVQVDACQPHSGLAFTNCQIMATVKVGPDNRGPVKFTNCGFWPIPGTPSQAVLEGNSTSIFEACHFSGWATDKSDAACIDLRRGVALIHACDFADIGKPQLRLGPQADGASVVGCRLRGGERFQIDEQVRDRLQAGLNLIR